MDWFTIETIDKDTYAISEYSHWEESHVYLLIGEEEALLIDSGLGIGNIKEKVEELTLLPIKVVTTHVHWDHIGGHKYFKDIYVHKEDAKWLQEGLPIPDEVVKKQMLANVDRKTLPVDFDHAGYEVFTTEHAHVIEEGHIFDLGNRKVQIIHTPGHSPGHLCLYEEDRGYLYTGDLVYKGTLYAFYPSTDPVAFRDSIDKICSLPNITRLLPGHHGLDIASSMRFDIQRGFRKIEELGQLQQGAGIFEFEGFQIHI